MNSTKHSMTSYYTKLSQKHTKKAKKNLSNIINEEAKDLATELDIEDRMECMAKQQAFISLKDHKENIQINPTCRLINPAKSEMGLVSKKILEKLNAKIRSLTSLSQWKNTASVINWFNNIPNKANSIFIVFDIESFYPFISEELLKMSINYAKQFIRILEWDIDIIMHLRKSFLFHQDAAWVKKGNSGLFDVTMGSYDGAEVCELVGLYILTRLIEKFDKESTGLYHDDGLAIFSNINGPQADRIKKDVKRIFIELGQKIERLNQI